MIKKTVNVAIEDNMDAKFFAKIAQQANKYNSVLFIELDNKRVNLKSVVGMMSLELTDGTEVTMMAEGDDAEKALEDLSKIIAK